jgi:redox-sensitive bicupin YhaK (pirin superfamily)
MSAGTGIAHSEFNASKTEPVRLLQIWIEPSEKGIRPSYEQKSFPLAEQPGRLHLIGSPDGRGGSVTIRQDLLVSAGRLRAKQGVSYDMGPDRHAWLQVARGDLTVNGTALRQGDGLAASDESKLIIEATQDAELLIFDLA